MNQKEQAEGLTGARPGDRYHLREGHADALWAAACTGGGVAEGRGTGCSQEYWAGYNKIT